MGFVGRLEDLGVADLFQILSLGKRTGKLTLTRRRDQGLIVFRNGGIVFCQTNAIHETLGSILVNRGLIDEATLLAALDRQQSGDTRPLGSILVGMGAISEEQLRDVVYEQVKAVLSEVMSWESGVFQFEPVEVPEAFQATFDASEFLVEEGLRPEELVLDLLTQRAREERKGHDGPPDPQEEGITLPGPAGEVPAGGGARGRGFASLRAIMTELRRRPATFTGEVTLMLLRYAAEVVNRGVLFSRVRNEFVGIGQFGIELEGEPAGRRVRSLRIPAAASSVLAEVAERGEPYRGRLAKTYWNTHLVQQLGGMTPREVVVIPILVHGRTVAVVYGDNLPEDTPIGPTEGLELLMIEAGLLLEKQELEQRLRRLEPSAGTERTGQRDEDA